MDEEWEEHVPTDEELRSTLDVIRERGYLVRLENTDAWFLAHDRPPKVSWDDALFTEAVEIASNHAHALIDAGLVKERLRYLLGDDGIVAELPAGGGTLVVVYTPLAQPQQTEQAAAD